MTTGLKIIFAGTPEFAAVSLQALLSSQHQIIAVYTQPDRPAGRGQKLQMSAVKQIAQDAQLPIYQPSKFNKDVCLQVKQLNADVMVVSAYGLMLPKEVLITPKLGCVNIHASLLPRWRGAAPIQRAIIAGDKQTGITIMQMVEKLDAGPCLYQQQCEITAEETGASLHDRLANLSAQKIAQVLQQLKDQQLVAVPQNESLVTYAKKLSKTEANINWHESATQIERKIRAYNAWPVAYTFLEGARIRIWNASTSSAQTQLDPGTVIEANDQGIQVATGEGILQIHTLQLSGAKQISAKDFNNAHNILHQCFRNQDKALVS